MVDWSCIPRELVGTIANNFSTVEDQSAFSAVCRSYRFATKGEQWRPASGLPPWLLLCCPDGDEKDGCCNQRGLISMCRNKRRFMMNLPELHGRYFWGTPYGWIVTLSMDNKFHLFNPFNRSRIVLPDLDPESNRRPLPSVRIKGDLRRFRSISKVILIKRSSLSSSCSSSAADNDFIVVQTFELGMLRVMRENTWVEVTFKGRWSFVNEVICYQGQIYALGNRGRLLIGSNFDDPTLQPTLDDFVSFNPSLQCLYTEHYYIVESLGQLLLVVRYIEEIEEDLKYRTCDFEVYKLNFETKKWIEIEDDLGDCALFVGNCQSFSLSNPKDFNCRSNCIYFTDDNYEEFFRRKALNDMGIYDFKERTIEPFYQGEDSLSIYSTPTWLLPAPI